MLDLVEVQIRLIKFDNGFSNEPYEELQDL